MNKMTALQKPSVAIQFRQSMTLLLSFLKSDLGWHKEREGDGAISMF